MPATNIARARKAAGLTQQQVAEAAGISQPYYQEIEAGIKVPWEKPSDLLHRIASALSCEVAELLEEK